jgi:hypothetical protein
VSDAEGMKGNRVTMQTSKSKCSDLMRLVQLKHNLFRICPTKTRALSTDRYQAWENLEFDVKRDDDEIVTCLSRKGVDTIDDHIRET